MGRCVPILLLLSSTALASVLCAGCAREQPTAVAVDLMCTETTRFHTTDEQRAAAKADLATWFTLFQWLASFDAVRDKRCA